MYTSFFCLLAMQPKNKMHPYNMLKHENQVISSIEKIEICTNINPHNESAELQCPSS